MFKISIPKPCFEGWENMLPNERGRYCNACAKTVVDFSVMSDEAVQQYFVANYAKQICGRFKNTQIQRIQIDLPENIFRIQLPFWKKFFIAFLIIYGASFFSIDTTIAGIPYHTSNAFYEKSQGEPFVKKEKKRKKRKSKLSFKTVFNLPEIMISGYTVTIPEKPACVLTDSIIIIPEQITTATNTPSIKQTVVKNITTNKSKPRKKLPDNENIAFILPTAFATIKPFSKKKKA